MGLKMHEKHRERLRAKLFANSEILEEHELLEILLFYAIPRKNTNHIAHQLIDSFGSIDKVLNTDSNLLSEIDGIGKSTACYLNTLGQVFNKYYAKDNFPTIFSFEQIREPIKKLFENQKNESFIAFFLDKNQKIIGKKIVCDHVINNVEIDLTELAKQVIALKPHYVVMAHNHLSGMCYPTQNDDNTTEKIMLMLKLHNTILADHLIVTNSDVYSYYYENRIDDIREKVDKLI